MRVLDEYAGDQPDALVRKRLEHPLHEVRLADDVVVDEDDTPAVSTASTPRLTARPKPRFSSLPQHPDAGKACGDRLCRAVGGGVVNDQDVVLDRLPFEARERLQKELTGIPGRNHDGRSHAARYANLGVVSKVATGLLSSPEAGGRVVRGGLIRGIGFGVGVLLAAGTSALLLRHLGVHNFGRYGAVAALLGIVGGVGDAGLTAIGARELSLVHGSDQARLMRNLVTLRLLITPIGILGAVVFALAVYRT